MDNKNKKLSGKVRTMIVGAFFVFGIAILVWSIFFFKPSVGDKKQRIHVRFANIEGISEGSKVTYAGKPAGEVIEITQIANAREKGVDQAGYPYIYDVELALDSSVNVYSTDLIELKTAGLLGDKSIAIIPQHVNPGEKTKSVIGSTINAESSDPITATLKTVATTSDTINQTMKSVTLLIQENSEMIKESIENLNIALQGAATLINQANEMNILGSINQTAQDISAVANNTNQLINRFRSLQIVEKMDLTLMNLGTTIQNVNRITSSIARGQGTLGKMIQDPTLYLQASDFFKRVNQLVYDINTFGLFFQKRSRWKELQRERLAQMDVLSSPKTFVREVGTELKQINQSVNKIGTIIEHANESNQQIIDSNEFRKYFYNLLQEINQLKNMLELYNQKITSPELKPQ